MPKKGRNRKSQNASDFTLEDSANAPKPVRKLKKAADVVTPTPTEVSREQLADNADGDLVEEIQSDGTKIYKKKRNHSRTEYVEDHGITYPEIVWYLISHYIKPEDIGRFAAINHATYAITKRESFWRNLFRRYCRNSKKLPERLQIENSFQVYGLRQRVIRALFHTYNVFVQRVALQSLTESRPHELVGRRCVNLWYSKGGAHWVVYLKLKKVTAHRFSSQTSRNMIEELGRLDANPEEDTQVLQVNCVSVSHPPLPPALGLTLRALHVSLGAGLRHRRLQLGLAHGPAAPPHCWLLLDHVIALQVVDWWHPLYPHFDTALRPRDEEDAPPVLRTDFFT